MFLTHTKMVKSINTYLCIPALCNKRWPKLPQVGYVPEALPEPGGRGDAGRGPVEDMNPPHADLQVSKWPSGVVCYLGTGGLSLNLSSSSLSDLFLMV